jgi:hypothetical protein
MFFSPSLIRPYAISVLHLAAITQKKNIALSLNISDVFIRLISF